MPYAFDIDVSSGQLFAVGGGGVKRLADDSQNVWLDIESPSTSVRGGKAISP